MRAFILLGTAAVLAATPGSASVLTFGSTYAASCYRAAEDRAPTRQAFDACNTALQVEGLTRHDEVATHVNRGALFVQTGQKAQALRDFDRALALNPREPEAWLNKARIALEQGDSAAGGAMAEKALAFGTRKPALAHYVRAAAREDRGEIRAAYADLVRARELDPRWALPAEELSRFQVRRR